MRQAVPRCARKSRVADHLHDNNFKSHVSLHNAQWPDDTRKVIKRHQLNELRHYAPQKGLSISSLISINDPIPEFVRIP